MKIMNQYDDFPDFMLSVVNAAVRKLPGLFRDETVRLDVEKALHEGWEYFTSITSVIDRSELTDRDYLALSKNTWLAFATLGLGADSSTGGSAMLINLQRHREIPIAIRNVGLMYKTRFENLLGERVSIDSLVEKASDELVRMIK